ncbi:DUF805 domain-containing protein [Defluviicoccus vanus]|uniref:DUF805 domain-containing protein n=1 Tax=Defluviicoccus vanus TaxID=111831 RepID=A0A7H1N490_9PROT|nr:DUF805 domain-containing protein [Defluviicoccus vanus]QNT70526.1 DUF805 domain-containing protein [Defluviicoccus vanus]
MLTALFGDVRDGRLQRLPYLGYCLLLLLLVFAIGVAFTVLLGGSEGLSEAITGGDAEKAKELLLQHLSSTAISLLLVATIVIGAAISFANINLQAKRLRDMGLPGWLGVAAIFGLELVITALVGNQTASIFHLVTFLALLLIPTATFAGRRGPA